MRILCYNSSLSWGGLEMNLVERAQWFCHAGIEVHFARVEKSPTDKALSGVSEIQCFHVEQNRRYVPANSAAKVARYCKKHSIDILLITDARDLSLAAWVRRFNRSTTLVYMQGMKLGMPKKGLLHTWRFNQLDAWISPLPYLQDQVKSWTRLLHSKSFCIPLGIDPKRVLPTKSRAEMLAEWQLNAKHVFGVLGRLDRQKGQKDVIQSFISAFDMLDPVALIMKGDPTRGEGEDYLHEINELIVKTDRSHQIKIVPFDPKVGDFFAGIDTLIMSSKSETYGMVTIEALHAGRFVIGTNSGGTPDILGSKEVGVLYDFGDIGELTRQLKHALSVERNPEVIQDYAKSRFSKEKELESLLELFRSITFRKS